MNINQLIEIVKNKLNKNIFCESIEIEDKTFLHKSHNLNDKSKFHIKLIITSAYLKEKNKIGIVVKISYDRRYQYPATNAYVLWGTNEESWCLGEALIVLSKANEK